MNQDIPPSRFKKCIRFGCLEPQVPSLDGRGSLCEKHLMEREEMWVSQEDRFLSGRIPKYHNFGPSVLRDPADLRQWFVDCPTCHYNKSYWDRRKAVADRDTHICDARTVRRLTTMKTNNLRSQIAALTRKLMEQADEDDDFEDDEEMEDDDDAI